MYLIKKYEEAYKEGVEDVCVAASSRAKGKDSEWGRVILHLFCRYYIEEEPNHCFIAVDEYDKVIGYVICASDYDTWKSNFKEKYLDTRNEIEIVKFGEMSIQGLKNYSKEYPAHLHINVHPNYQRLGIGNELIKVLLSKLKEEKVNGLMLDVSATNEKGINFYRKCGFIELEKREHDILFGMKL